MSREGQEVGNVMACVGEEKMGRKAARWDREYLAEGSVVDNAGGRMERFVPHGNVSIELAIYSTWWGLKRKASRKLSASVES